MELILRLVNPATDAEKIELLMRASSARVFVEDGRTTVAISGLIESALDLSDPRNASQVWQRVHEFTAIATAAAKVGGIHVKVELENLMYLDSSGHRLPMPITGEGHSFLPSLRAGAPVPPERLVKLGLQDVLAAKVLRLFARSHSWVNLYRILEAIGDDYSDTQLVSKGWASAAEITAFRASANHVAVTGDDSRHGRSNGTPPRRTISHQEAQNLISRIVRLWLQDRDAKLGVP